MAEVALAEGAGESAALAECACEADECCVCYGLTCERTRCGHPLCGYCLSLLRKPECPLCRNELTPGALARHVAAAALTSSRARPLAHHDRGGGTLASRLRGQRRGASHTPRRRLLAAPALPPGAPVSDSITTGHMAADTSGLPLAPRARTSPFTVWLRERDGATNAVGNDSIAVDILGAADPTAAAVAPDDGESLATEGRAPNGRGVRISSLVSRIGRMTLSEAPRFIEHVVWLQQQGLLQDYQCRGVATLQQALQRRLAELISVAPLHMLADAGGLVASLESTLQRSASVSYGGVGHSTNTRRSGGLLGENLRRALEARLLYLLYNSTVGGSSPSDTANPTAAMTIEDLRRLCLCTAGLRGRRLVGPEVHATCVGHARKWLERAALGLLMRESATVATLVMAENSLFTVLLARLRRAVDQQPMDAGPDQRVTQLDRVMRLLLAFEDLGVQLLGIAHRGPRGHGRECSNSEETRALEDALTCQIRKGFAVWPPGHLMDLMADDAAGLLKLCRTRPLFAQDVRSSLSARLVRSVTETCGSVRRACDIAHVREELLSWAGCARRASAAGVLALEAADRVAVVSAATKCTATCMDLPDCANHIEEVQDMEWKMVALVSGVAAS